MVHGKYTEAWQTAAAREIGCASNLPELMHCTQAVEAVDSCRVTADLVTGV